MDVLVTGSSGYIGAALVQFFRAKGVETVGIDRVPSATTALVGDLVGTLCLQDLRLDAIFHLAGLFEKNFQRRNSISADSYLHDNVKSAEHALTIAEMSGARLVVASTWLLAENWN